MFVPSRSLAGVPPSSPAEVAETLDFRGGIVGYLVGLMQEEIIRSFQRIQAYLNQIVSMVELFTTGSLISEVRKMINITLFG